jgi:hypothetical protein
MNHYLHTGLALNSIIFCILDLTFTVTHDEFMNMRWETILYRGLSLTLP